MPITKPLSPDNFLGLVGRLLDFASGKCCSQTCNFERTARWKKRANRSASVDVRFVFWYPKNKLVEKLKSFLGYVCSFFNMIKIHIAHISVFGLLRAKQNYPFKTHVSSHISHTEWNLGTFPQDGVCSIKFPHYLHYFHISIFNPSRIHMWLKYSYLYLFLSIIIYKPKMNISFWRQASPISQNPIRRNSSDASGIFFVPWPWTNLYSSLSIPSHKRMIWSGVGPIEHGRIHFLESSSGHAVCRLLRLDLQISRRLAEKHQTVSLNLTSQRPEGEQPHNWFQVLVLNTLICPYL